MCVTRIGLSLILLFVLQNGVFSPDCAAQSATPNLSQPVKRDSIVRKRQKKSPKGAMLRSLAFPGWGQVYNHQFIKAGLVVSAQGVLIFLMLRYNSKASDHPDGTSKHELYIDRRNLTFWLMGAVTALSMLDAYIDAHLYDFDTGPDLELRVGGLRPTVRSRSFGLTGVSLRLRF
ncbi:MAG: hypothetical protein D6743_18790 [Calditrichaeota bacterium]|nr:MAG: hypothetical protein D6743_18790 [Calditrichota bacterium]